MTAAVARSIVVTFANRQRTRPIRLPVLRAVVETLLRDLLEINTAKLGVSLVATREMTRLNENFLQHTGATDVITFDYSEPATRNAEPPTRLHGEIFICVDEAIRHAHRFHTNWQSELVRYLVHGVLHLMGHDDQHAPARSKMKREENRLLRRLAARFPLSQLARKSKLPT
jgi:probable rRNA maturation factor